MSSMHNNWIGPKIDTTGGYFPTRCDELKVRSSPSERDKVSLYKFETRFGEEFNISDPEVIAIINDKLENEDLETLYPYLYELVIARFGIIAFLRSVETFIARERDEGYRNGKEHLQAEMRKLLGVRGW